MEEKARKFRFFGNGVPTLLLGALWALLPLVHDRSLADPYDLPKGAAASLLGVLGGALGLLLVRRPRIPAEGTLGLLFVGFSASAHLWSEAPSEGRRLLVQALGHLGWWVLGVLAIRDESRLRMLLRGVTLGGAGVATLGILQHLALDDWSGPLGRLPQTDRPGSVFGHVNMASEWVALAALAGIWETVRSLRERAWGSGLFAIATLLPVPVFLVVGGSRAAWLALVCGIVTIFLCELRLQSTSAVARRRLLGWATGGAVAAILLFALLDQWVVVPGRGETRDVAPRERLLALRDSEAGTLDERRILWANSLALWKARPWSGVGPGNWKIRYPAFSRAVRVHPPGRFSFERQPERVHMDPLQLLCETGVVGSLLLGAWVLCSLARAGSSVFRREPSAPLGVPVLGLWACALFFALVAFPFQDQPFGSLCFLLLGAGAAGAGGRAVFTPGAALRRILVALALVSAIAIALHHHGSFRASAAMRRAQMSFQAAWARIPAPLSIPARRRALLASLDDADRAATRDPSNYRHQLLRARLLRELGRGDAAASVLERVLDLHPRLAQALCALADLRQREGRPKEALKLLHRAVALQPDTYEVRLALGLHFEAQRRDTEALHQYGRALQLREHAPDARLRRARILLLAGQGPAPAGVIGELGRCEREMANDPARLVTLARLYAHPRLGQASPVFGAAGKKTLDLWRRAAALSGNQDGEAVLEAAMAPLKRALSGQRAPLSPNTLNSLLRLAESFEGDPALHTRVLYFQAHLHEMMGDDDGALVTWTRLLREFNRDERKETFSWILDEALDARLRIDRKLLEQRVREGRSPR